MEEARKKIRYFCDYRDRAHSEVKAKLREYGLNAKEQASLLVEMIEENLLNEERYAIAFAGGKFRVNHWGKEKIKAALKMKGVSTYCINKALMEIDENDYYNTLFKLYRKQVKHTQKLSPTDKRKLVRYLREKGYTLSDIHKCLDAGMNDKTP